MYISLPCELYNKLILQNRSLKLVHIIEFNIFFTLVTTNQYPPDHFTLNVVDADKSVLRTTA